MQALKDAAGEVPVRVWAHGDLPDAASFAAAMQERDALGKQLATERTQASKLAATLGAEKAALEGRIAKHDAEKAALDHAAIIAEAGILAPDVKPAGKPSACMYASSLSLRAPSSATG